MSEASAAEISKSRMETGNRYAHWDGDNEFSALTNTPHLSAKDINFELGLAKRYDDIKIEKIVRSFQNKLWKERNKYWHKNIPSQPQDIIDPVKLLELFGYQIVEKDSIRYNNKNGSPQEYSGLLDSDTKTVVLSKKFSRETQAFTAAHELGHILLHGEQRMHRDLPKDSVTARNGVELEADKFAAFLLLPEKIVRDSFKARFKTDNLTVDQNTMFLLRGGVDKKLLSGVNTVRDFSRLVAKTARYNDRDITPISASFNVSVEAMAIRLEELELVSL